jgi:hypothetical protein
MAFLNQSTNVLFGPQSRDLGGNTYQYESAPKGGKRSRVRKSRKAKKSRKPKTKKSWSMKARK